MRRPALLCSVALLLVPLLCAKDKTKAILPADVLRAQTVAVVIEPGAGEPLTDPGANRGAQEAVENALADRVGNAGGPLPKQLVVGIWTLAFLWPNQLGGIPQLPLPLVAGHQFANLALQVSENVELGEHLAGGFGQSHELLSPEKREAATEQRPHRKTTTSHLR